MAGYLVYDDADPETSFKAHSVMPASTIDDVETVHAGWLDKQLEIWSRHFDARLRKRYTVPFANPAPQIVRGWLADVVTFKAYLRLGVNPLDEDMRSIQKAHDDALENLKEAASGELALIDLPTDDEEDASAVTKGAPRVYSEASPFVHRDVQRRVGVGEDSFGEGSSS